MATLRSPAHRAQRSPRSANVPERFESPDLSQIQTLSYRAFTSGRRTDREARRPGTSKDVLRELFHRKLRQDAPAWSTKVRSGQTPYEPESAGN